MAVQRLLLCPQLRKRLSDLRKIKQRIISESIRPPRSIKDDAFGCTVKRSQSLPIPRRGQDANEPARPSFGRYVLQFPQDPGVVGFIIRIPVCFVRLFIVQIGSSVARRMHPRRAA